jgi:hypothetical protein
MSPSKSTRNRFININCSFWVCEKSDGIRVIMFICLAGDGHDVFLVRFNPACNLLRLLNSH